MLVLDPVLDGPMAAPPSGRRCAVVIAAHAILRDTIAGALETLGYGADGAPDGGSGIHLIEQLNPDLIVLDLALPGGSGADVLAALRARAATSPTPLLVLADFASQLPSTGPYEQVLVTPFAFADFRRAIESLAASDPAGMIRD